MRFTPTRRLRLLVSSLVLTLATAGIVATTASPASADPVVPVPCPSWVGAAGWFAKPLGVVSSSPTFLVSETRIADNSQIPYPVTATFSSSTAHTYGISATAGITFTGLFGFLNVNVSSTITSSTTTTVGVSVQTTVPAYSRMYGDYGVEAYDVVFDAYWVIKTHSPGGCYVWADSMGYEQLHATAPTNNQGWRLRLG